MNILQLPGGKFFVLMSCPYSELVEGDLFVTPQEPDRVCAKAPSPPYDDAGVEPEQLRLMLRVRHQRVWLVRRVG
jgi:hypothetical protein